jgi:hypothetical protein
MAWANGMTMRGVALCICAAVCLPIHAEPATARYAPAQLRFAEEGLARAGDARARGELLLAERLAAQASLDARLAWSMSEAPALRHEAVQTHRRAAALMRAMRIDPGGHGIALKRTP